MVIGKGNIFSFVTSDGRIMDCSSSSNITRIEYIPEGVVTLHCDGNLITSICKLPDSLENIYCDQNRLTSLPDIPESLDTLFCSDNQLTDLPYLPNPLMDLYCKDNCLESYPTRNTTIRWIKDHNNRLKNINRSNRIKTILSNGAL